MRYFMACIVGIHSYYVEFFYAIGFERESRVFQSSVICVIWERMNLSVPIILSVISIIAKRTIKNRVIFGALASDDPVYLREYMGE